MDAAPPPDPPAIVAPQPAAKAAGAPAPAAAPAQLAAPAGGDLYARSPKEKELCERASSTDWLYIGASVAAVVGSVYLDSSVKYNESRGVRLLGPSAVGLSWGFLLGGVYLALPKCSPTWVGDAPAEGSVRRTWPLALSFALLSSITAPLLMGVEQGYTYPADWTLAERQGRVLLSGGLGFAGALLPYVLPPKTWRAARELARIRAEPYGDGAMLKYVVLF